MDSLNLNRDIAYIGTIGKQREEFCFNYIKHKHVLLNRIKQEIFKQIEKSGAEVTCEKGCSFCCLLYVEANIQECEAIVYYLYQNNNTLSLFLHQYPQWRDKMCQSGDIFRRCEQALDNRRNAEYNANTQQALADSLLFYKMQNIPCPFLYNGTCSIYEVRPFNCANHYVTTPAQWCDPLNPKQPKLYKIMIDEEFLDLSFYPRNLDKPLMLFMPLAIHEILNGGFSYLSTVTGLKELTNAMNYRIK